MKIMIHVLPTRTSFREGGLGISQVSESIQRGKARDFVSPRAFKQGETMYDDSHFVRSSRSQSPYRGESSEFFPSPRAYIMGRQPYKTIHTSLRGRELGIFPSFGAYIEGESSEFFKSQGLYTGRNYVRRLAPSSALLGPRAYIGAIFSSPTGYIGWTKIMLPVFHQHLWESSNIILVHPSGSERIQGESLEYS